MWRLKFYLTFCDFVIKKYNSCPKIPPQRSTRVSKEIKFDYDFINELLVSSLDSRCWLPEDRTDLNTAVGIHRRTTVC